MGWMPDIEELIELAKHSFATMVEDVMRLGDWISNKISEISEL